MHPQVTVASFDLSEDQRIEYTRGKGYYRAYQSNHVWYAQFKNFTIIETGLFKYPVAKSNYYRTFDECIETQIRSSEHKYSYNPDTHILLHQRASPIRKSVLKKRFRETVAELRACNHPLFLANNHPLFTPDE